MLTPKEQVIFEKGFKIGRNKLYQTLLVMLKNGVPLKQILEALSDPEDFQDWLSECEQDIQKVSF